MATKVTDPITKITGTTYDSLGRGTQAWLPNRLRAFGAALHTALHCDYHPSKDTAPWSPPATSDRQPRACTTSYTIYDSLLGARETQPPPGGRLVNPTRYDTRGLASLPLSDILGREQRIVRRPGNRRGRPGPL